MRIEVSGMKLPFRGGIIEDEHLLLQVLEIDVSVGMDKMLFIEEESLDQTLDYVQLAAFVKEEVSKGAKLLESLAHRIDTRIRNRWDNILSVDIRIRKQPSLGLAYDFVEVHWTTP